MRLAIRVFAWTMGVGTFLLAAPTLGWYARNALRRYGRYRAARAVSPGEQA